jgi:hypothetical protein
MNNGDDDYADEPDLIAYMTEDLNEFTLVIKGKDGQKLTADDIMVELESYVHELNKAVTQKSQPGVQVH